MDSLQTESLQSDTWTWW